tara:strand:+ start:329 stop:652 length:324 start_codon:yes stop_codon:yes gene_type:complete
MKNTNPHKDSNNPFRQSIWISSPSHAWLAVPRELLKRYELEQSISSYSYQGAHPDGTQVVFLEEDCDATKLINTVGVWKFKIAEGNGWIKEISVNDNYFDRVESYRV